MADDAPTDALKGCPLKAYIEGLWNAPHQRSTQPIRPTSQGYEFEKMLAIIEAEKEEYTDFSAFRGNPTTNFRLAARNVHLQTRELYNHMMTNIGNNVFPVMLLSDADDGVPGGVGGMITIYQRNLSIQRIVPTPPSYELLKNLSHMTLGVFVVVSPWFRCENGLETGDASLLLTKVKEAHKAANNPAVQFEQNEQHILETAKILYGIVEKYLEAWIAAGNCSVEDFQKFAEEMDAYVPNNIKEAATIQANSLYPELKKIKEEMGPEWEKLYVVVPTVWPVSGINPRVEILARLMEPGQIHTRVFVLDNMSSMAQYRQTLGRILGDRCSANLIFGRSSHIRESMLYALATRQDLMANACDEAMKVIEDRESAAQVQICPAPEPVPEPEEVTALLEKELTFEKKGSN